MCTESKVCVLHAAGWIANTLGGNLRGVEHTKLGKIPKVELRVNIGKARAFDVDVVLVEIAEDRWTLRATVNTHAMSFSGGPVATAYAAGLCELRDGLALVDLFIAEHSHQTKGWWSTAEIREAIEVFEKAHNDFVAKIHQLLEEASNHKTLGRRMGGSSTPVGEA